MKTKGILEGIDIIRKYIKDQSGWDFHGEHDQLWFGSEELPISEADKKRLLEIDWFVDEESWSCFV